MCEDVVLREEQLSGHLRLTYPGWQSQRREGRLDPDNVAESWNQSLPVLPVSGLLLQETIHAFCLELIKY